MRLFLPGTVALPAKLYPVPAAYEAHWWAQEAAGLVVLFTEDGVILRLDSSSLPGRT
jgi:hypothetical protein